MVGLALNSLSSLMIDLPMKPSSGQTLDFHQRCSASVASSVYLRLLCSNASSTASSQGPVSSMMYTMWSEEDRSTRSGLRFVMAISEGKQSLWFRSVTSSSGLADVRWYLDFSCLYSFSDELPWTEGWTDVGDRALNFIRLTSKVAARHFRTWLCRQVYRPCDQLVLQPTRICLRFGGDGQRGHVGSSPYHWLRFESLADGFHFSFFVCVSEWVSVYVCVCVCVCVCGVCV